MDAKQTPLVDLLRLHADDLHSAHGHNQSSRLLSRAADEVDQLKSNLVALEDEKNSYIDYVGDALGQDHDGETLWDAAQRVLSERDRLRAELEASETELRIVRASQAESNAEVERLRTELAVARADLAVSVGHLSRLAEAYGCDDFTSAIDAALAAKGEE